MFIAGKYTNTYFRLIEKAKSRNLTTRKMAVESLGYVECHHIIPKSLNGEDAAHNLIFLTPKEHLICHKLLVKMTVGKNRTKMVWGLHKMMSCNKNQNRKIFTSRDYEYVRKLVTSIPKEEHHNYGKKRSEQWKKDRSAAYAGSGNPTYGKRWKCTSWNGDNSGQNNPMYGRKQKADSRALQSERAKNRPKVSCIHCRTCSDISNFVRWHKDKCFQKDS